MICTNCGQNLSEDAKFCGHCGAKVQKQAQAPKKRFCTMCGAECEENQLFCSVCGVKLSGPSATASPVSQTAAATPAAVRVATAPLAANGKLLKTINMVAMYIGEPTIVVSDFPTGKLLVYDDRIEFIKQMGNALTLVGMIKATAAIKKDPIDVFPINQISELKINTYMGFHNMLVIKTKDGMVRSFSPVVPGSSGPKDIIELLRPYL